MHGQAQPHDVRVEGSEVQGRSVVRKRAQIDLEKVDSEFPIQVMKLVLVLFGLFVLWDLLETVKIIGALRIHAFMDNKELAAFDRHQ